MNYIQAFKILVKELGFVVIHWDPKRGPWIDVGDELESVWGCGPAPVESRITGSATRRDWDRQVEILRAHGAPQRVIDVARKPIKGWRFSKLAPVDSTRPN